MDPLQYISGGGDGVGNQDDGDDDGDDDDVHLH